MLKPLLFSEEELIEEVKRKLKSSYFHYGARILQALYKDAYDISIDSDTNKLRVDLVTPNE